MFIFCNKVYFESINFLFIFIWKTKDYLKKVSVTIKKQSLNP